MGGRTRRGGTEEMRRGWGKEQSGKSAAVGMLVVEGGNVDNQRTRKIE